MSISNLNIMIPVKAVSGFMNSRSDKYVKMFYWNFNRIINGK